MIHHILTSLGYHVVSAGLPSEAITLAQEFEGEIDMVLTDVIMPGMNGSHVAARISEIHPDALVLFMSGYPYDTLEQHQIAPKHFLAKPFSKDELAGKVQELIAASAQQESMT